MDEYDIAIRDALAARDRTIAQQSREIETLVTALSVHEGRDVHVTALAHLGHPLTHTRPWRHDDL